MTIKSHDKPPPSPLIQNAKRNGTRFRHGHGKSKFGHDKNERIDSKERGEEEFHHHCGFEFGCGRFGLFDIVFVNCEMTRGW
jgi:hypothetical protein